MTNRNATDYRAISLRDAYASAKCARGNINRLYFHWTAGRYGQYFPDYHLLVDGDGTLIATSRSLNVRLAHTSGRNSGAVGVALCCCAGALARDGRNCDFGKYPPTAEQIEASAQLMAVLCRGLALPLSSLTVLTHCEAAQLDGYGPYSGDPETRWDLWYLPDSARGGAMAPGGDVLRGKGLWYYHEFFCPGSAGRKAA